LSKRIILATLFTLLLVSILGLAFYAKPVGASGTVGVKTGDWIKYDYTVTGEPPDVIFTERMKVEFLNVEETNATMLITMRMSDGTEQNKTITEDIMTGRGTLDTIIGIVVPTNSTTGDSIYISGYGNITIESEQTRTYVGASRTVLSASFFVQGASVTYYWDKQTGIMVESDLGFMSITATAKAYQTNMWQASTIIHVAPSPINVANGETFTVNVTISNVTDLYTWQIKLSFDPTILHCTGAWYPSDNVFAGKETVTVNPVINETEGYVLYGCCLLGASQETFNGNGTLCQIQFKALSPGNSSLEFSGPKDTFLLDFDLYEIPYATYDCYIAPRGNAYCDLNNDGNVNVGDISLAAMAFSSYPSHPRWNAAADINKDDKVDIIDLVLIAISFNERS
jgi:hypothetical protein